MNPKDESALNGCFCFCSRVLTGDLMAFFSLISLPLSVSMYREYLDPNRHAFRARSFVRARFEKGSAFLMVRSVISACEWFDCQECLSKDE
jgi:hypothetical protein